MLHRPVPEDEPWILDIVEGKGEGHGWMRAVVVGIVAGLDEEGPTEVRAGYQLLLVDGSGHGVFPRERVRVVEPGGGIKIALEGAGAARHWHPGDDREEEEDFDDALASLRARCTDLH